MPYGKKPAKKTQPKPKAYTQKQVDAKMKAAAKSAANPIPTAKKQAAMKKKQAEKAMDAKMKEAAKRNYKNR